MAINSNAFSWPVLVLASFLGTPVLAAEEHTYQAAIEDATADPDDPVQLQKLLSKIPKTKSGKYIVDGDVLLTESEIRRLLLERREALAKDARETLPKAGELIVNTVSDVPTCYRSASDRKLSYAIDTASFASAPQEKAADVIAGELRLAIKEWTDACPECGFEFTFIDDPKATPETASFVVRYDGAEKYIAAAFFPNDTPEYKYLSIANQYFNSEFRRVGVLAHEIGHIFGYRHEHIRKEAPIQCMAFGLEGKDWKALGNYNKKSVMHYLCKDHLGNPVAGSDLLEVTLDDAAAHRDFYMNKCIPTK